LHEIAENLFLEIYNKGEETKLEKLLFEVKSGSRSKGGAVNSGIPSIGAEKVEKLGAYDFSSEKYISEEYYDKMKNGIVKSGDVLLYKDGAYTGKVSMALNDFPHKKCAVNEHVFILRTENNLANNYLYFLLYYNKTQEQISSMARSKAAQPGLNQTELKSTIVNIPNKEIIEYFEEKVKPLVNKIVQNSIENRTLTELRDTLLTKLMNGEIDLDKIEI
jgi:type I restriction enzyme, S subunit